MDRNVTIIRLTDIERLTLADAIDAYRSVRIEDKECMRLDYFDRMSPAELDGLQADLLSRVGEKGKQW